MKAKTNVRNYFCLMMVLSLCACASTTTKTAAQTSAPQLAAPVTAGMDLDAAAKEAAAQIDKKIPQGTKVALVSLASPSAAFSEQVMLRLESALVSSGKVVVVDRANLDKIRAEQGFQLSGEVDDDSAKAIGKLLGAGAIVTGSTVDMGDVYGLALKAINIETATVAVSYLAELTKTERIKTLMASGGGASGTQPATAARSQPAAAAPASTAQAQAPAAPPPSAPVEPPKPVVYKVGDKGPAGGFIFYDKGDNEGGWRYLEAAPASSEFKALWSANGSGVDGTETGIGTGKKNTQIIMEAALRTGQDMPAARQCARLRYGGYEDWFLPSKAELGLMYFNLKTEGIGGFSGEYLSSSEDIEMYWGRGNSWVQSFSNGTQFGTRDVTSGKEKNIPRSVRAIRQF